MPRLLQDPLREYPEFPSFPMGQVRTAAVAADAFSISSQVGGMNVTAFMQSCRSKDLQQHHSQVKKLQDNSECVTHHMYIAQLLPTCKLIPGQTCKMDSSSAPQVPTDKLPEVWGRSLCPEPIHEPAWLVCHEQHLVLGSHALFR